MKSEELTSDTFFYENVLLFTLHRLYNELSVSAGGKIILKDGKVFSYDFSREVDILYSLSGVGQIPHAYEDLFEDKRYYHNESIGMIRQNIIINTLVKKFNIGSTQNASFNFEYVGDISEISEFGVSTYVNFMNRLGEESKLIRRFTKRFELDCEYLQDVSYYGIKRNKVLCLGCEYLYEDYISDDANARIIAILLSSFDGYYKYKKSENFGMTDSETYVEATKNLFDILENRTEKVYFPEETKHNDDNDKNNIGVWGEWD